MLSQITVSDIADFLRLDDVTSADEKFISQIMKSAVFYIKSYTGLSEQEMDEHDDLDIAFYVLCQDMYDNRTMYSDSAIPNRTIESILNMHAVNLL